ncbi:hypothetical protein EJ04DRAFT_517367 [Polyplosphaeria fusca]|uniref:C3H1-type domain-containing protein n=1 Tax=Polyplosphaeria fusca TaxID=682080 RepID=A0A9P4QIV9_9PLEO|nr:hypothetical protein EJ04DRAFT_517367 [Polyplosphaeria fusca]
MAVLSSPAGMQAMSQFASQMAAGVFPAQPSPTSPQVPPSQSAYRPHIGQKRKRDERPSTQQPPKSKSKPPRAKVAAAPAVPSFGFDLPALHAPKPFGPPKHNVKGAQKRPTVNLGLTSRGNYKEDIGAEDESEDDDEEALFASQSGAGADFEYEGQQMSLRTAAEIKAWIKDRKKQYPTRRRIVEKAQEAAEERDRELDFLQNLQAEKQKTTIQRPRFDETQKNVERKKPPREEQQRDFEGRRKRAPESLVAKPTQPQSSEPGTLINGSPPHKPAVIDLGLGYNSDSDSDDNSIISESSVLSSSDDSDSDSDDSSGAPQEMSSQIAPESKKVPLSAPAPKNAPGVKLKKVNDRVCLWWEKNGRCKHGYKCKFKHPPKEEPTKKGLFEVMVEKEIEEENWKVLRAIKWLGQHGYLG